MNKKEKILFEKLKKEVARTFLKENSAFSQNISEWRGDDIVRFQEDLLQKVKARVSEKWFYSYFRNTPSKLPRIDMLNLLAKYSGYKNWVEFRNKNYSSFKLKSLKKIYWIIGIFLVGILLALQFISIKKSHHIHLCFVDENLQTLNEKIILEITGPEQEVYTNEAKKPCIDFDTFKDSILIKIKSAYYLPKNIILYPDKDMKQKIMLFTDVNALILRRYSNKTKTDKKKIKKHLENLIADDAIIYQQWFGNEKGIEIYSKEEFIAQLLTPTSLVKHLEILDKKYKNGKIYRLRFTVNN